MIHRVWDSMAGDLYQHPCLPRRLSTRAAPAGHWTPLVTGPLGSRDLVVHVVLAGWFFHRQALDLLQGRGIVHDERAVHFPDADQRVFAVWNIGFVGQDTCLPHEVLSIWA